jgi:hypothetical protein
MLCRPACTCVCLSWPVSWGLLLYTLQSLYPWWINTTQIVIHCSAHLSRMHPWRKKKQRWEFVERWIGCSSSGTAVPADRTEIPPPPESKVPSSATWSWPCKSTTALQHKKPHYTHKLGTQWKGRDKRSHHAVHQQRPLSSKSVRPLSHISGSITWVE